MHVLFLVGRTAFILFFLVSGVLKLMDIAGTAALIETHISIPDVFLPATEWLTSQTALTAFQFLAILFALVEIVCASLIAINLTVRFSSLVLAIMLTVGTYYAHDFWNMAADVRSLHARMFVMHVAILGGLLMMMAVGPWRPELYVDDYAYSR